MIDHSKRQTLKKVAGIGAGTAALAASAGVMGGLVSGNPVFENCTTANEGTIVDLADIEIRTRVSAVTNDIEVVLKNTGSGKATITDMTPAEIHTARGKFDFNALFEKGALNIETGESISVPLQHIAPQNSTLQSKIKSSVNSSLKQKLASTVSIITDGDSLAAVTIIA